MPEQEEKPKLTKAKYGGNKWGGKYLRAPEIYYTILEKGKGKLVRLGDIAEVRRGFTTGADPWFYVKNITAEAGQLGPKEGPAKYRVILSGDNTKWVIEKECIAPALRNPDTYRAIFIDTSNVSDFVILVREEPKTLRKKSVIKYIEHGEKSPYKMGKGRTVIPSETETCRSRQLWFQLPDVKPSRLFWQKAVDVYHRHFLADKPILANQRFYPIYPKGEGWEELIACFINSTLTALYLEFQRTIMGLGAIEATVDEVKQVPIGNPRLLKAPIRARLIEALEKVGPRPVGSIFEELGATSPEEVSMDKVLPDRRELDKVVFEALGLTEEEQIEVYRAVVELVKNRLAKARSLKST